MIDILIIGAGPSGSLCGYLLAKAGFAVTIVEKRAFPRRKLCGGGISYKACQALDGIIDLGLLKGKALAGSYLCYRAEHLTYVGQKETSYSIDRAEFDAALLRAAQSSGADLVMPAEVVDIDESASEVTVTLRDGKFLNAAFVVLAEGANGRLHEKLGYAGKRDWTMALEVDLTPPRPVQSFETNTLFDFGSIPRGYGWIFPKAGYLNVGAYFYRSKKIDRDQEKSLERFVRQFSWSDSANIGPVKGYPVPYLVDLQRFNSARTLLVGDSAGAVENFFGEGIYYGLASSRLAAEVITDTIHRHASLDRYTALLKSQILTQLKFSRITARLFYERQRFGYYTMLRSRLLNRFYAGLINGKITQKQCYFYTLLSLPFSPFTGRLPERDPHEIGLRQV